MSDSYINGGVTVWCEDGHDPKLLQGERTVQECPECGMMYYVKSSVRKMETLQKHSNET